MADVKSSKRCQPPWTPPSGSTLPKLKLFNSLSRQKEEFIPNSGKTVLWYSCGPTVYDASHMGHARSYISFDILRRVMAHYFNYNVVYVMNITDIDDKIIRRARQNHLIETYLKSNFSLEKVVSDISSAVHFISEKLKTTADVDKKEMLQRVLQQVETAVTKLQQATENSNEAEVEINLQQLLVEANDVLSEWLDDQLGATVTDNSIFSKLPRYWEEEFHKDMNDLNVLPADVITRVSEYIPEIIDFIEKIIEKSMAYVSDGSVYFNTTQFDQDFTHHYAKLVPEAFGDTKALCEGEGDLSISETLLNAKKSRNDFALWKSSKPGEPSWDSPWGKGRPGWHIECSVMASDILGESIDIHTGGIDLKFPHHDNELAQSEAYFGNDHWVRYFVHSGHLTISGCKMSKSLKNFITIKQALKEYSATQLRLAFLMHSWKDTLDYSKNTMEMAIHFEKIVNEFFLNVKVLLRTKPDSYSGLYNKWEKDEKLLHKKFLFAKAGVHEALCDNIDTPIVLDKIRALITACNLYIKDKRSQEKVSDYVLLESITGYIKHLLVIFGTFENESDTQALVKTTPANVEQVVMPIVSALANFRDEIRTVARQQKFAEILKMCDELRDDTLPNLGIRLEDHEGQPTVVKLVDRLTLIRERERKLKLEEEKRVEAERIRLQKMALQAAKDEQAKIPPSEMFRRDSANYSQFDNKGIPTHDKEDKELSKGQLKKLLKQYELQEKRYAKYVQEHEMEPTSKSDA